MKLSSAQVWMVGVALNPWVSKPTDFGVYGGFHKWNTTTPVDIEGYLLYKLSIYSLAIKTSKKNSDQKVTNPALLSILIFTHMLFSIFCCRITHKFEHVVFTNKGIPLLLKTVGLNFSLFAAASLYTLTWDLPLNRDALFSHTVCFLKLCVLILAAFPFSLGLSVPSIGTQSDLCNC